MALVTMQVTIGRTLLGLGDIVMANATSDTYQFGEFTSGGVQWERNTVTSPWVHGRRLRSARKGSATVTGELYVVSALSTGPDTHDAALKTLLDALGQFAWTLSIQAAGGGTALWQYACEPADVEQSDGETMMTSATYRWTTLNVTIPHSPLPSSGAW